MRYLSILLILCLAGAGSVIAFGISEDAPNNDDSERTESFTDEDYANHIEDVRERLLHDGFTIVLEKPFVVIGDESAEVVRRRTRQTVKWAVDLLKKDFFKQDPKYILDIWLFKDKKSYETHAIELFGSKPTTPFGYYSSANRALVMNISTGGGTLVHEIVHPFIESNFPDCPSWYNEGLGSLYEQCRERDGKIWGLTNWRLMGLKQAIEDDDLPDFETFCSTTSHEFYSITRGSNYAQARYLLYYLQEKGLLRGFHKNVIKDHKDDPTGYKTLQSVLGDEGQDMQAFKKKWEAFVMKLRFP